MTGTRFSSRLNCKKCPNQPEFICTTRLLINPVFNQEDPIEISNLFFQRNHVIK